MINTLFGLVWAAGAGVAGLFLNECVKETNKINAEKAEEEESSEDEEREDK